MVVTGPYIQRYKSEHILYPKAKSEQEMFACGCSLYYKAFQDYSYTFRIEVCVICFQMLPLSFAVWSKSFLFGFTCTPWQLKCTGTKCLTFLMIYMFKNTLFFPVDELIFDVKFFFFFFFFSSCKSLVFYVMFPRDYSCSIKKKRKCRTPIPWSPLPSLFSTINVRHLSFQGNDGREENFPFQKGKYFASFRRAAHQIF